MPTPNGSAKSDDFVNRITRLIDSLEKTVEHAKKEKKSFWGEGNLTDLEGEAERLRHNP